MKRSYSRAEWIALLGVGVLMLNMRGTQGDSWSLPSKITFSQKNKFRFPKFRCTFKHLPLMWSEHTSLLFAAVYAKSQDTTHNAANEVTATTTNSRTLLVYGDFPIGDC